MLEYNGRFMCDLNQSKLPLLSGSFTVSYVEIFDSSCVEFPHSHTNYEIYFCLEGSLQMRTFDITFPMREGHFVLITPGVRHEVVYRPDEFKKYLVMVFDIPKHTGAKSGAEFEKEFIDKLNTFLFKNSYHIGKAPPYCRGLVAHMQEELENKEFGWELSLRCCYMQFILSILRSFITKSVLDEDELPRESSASVYNMPVAITKYMHANYNKNITLQNAADAMYITPRHINRLFYEYFGQSFNKTLSIYRLNYAKNYLLHTDYSIEKIAGLVGLSSPKTLYKLFKEIEGMTVNEYRQIYSTGEKK